MKMLRKLETPTCPLEPEAEDPVGERIAALGAAAARRAGPLHRDHRRRPAAPSGVPGICATIRAPRKSRFQGFQRFQKVPKASVPKAGLKVLKISDSDIDVIVEQLNALEKARKNGRLTLPDGDMLEVTNLHKIFWPAIKKTKGDLIRYYAKISPFILPVIDNRPLVMKRLPNGVDGPSFYQHRAPDAPPPGVRIETLPSDDVPSRLIGGSLKTLLYMAQLASISMDPWFSTMDDLDSADQVAIDLDPQPGATFSQILDCARVGRGGARSREGAGLSEDLRLRRAARLHPAAAGHAVRSRDAVLPDHRDAWSRRSIRRSRRSSAWSGAARTAPSTSTTCRTSRARRSPAPTARARSAFAGVSTPLTWKEVRQRPKPQDFTIDTIHPRLKKVGDLWAKMRKHKGTDLLAAIEKLRK